MLHTQMKGEIRQEILEIVHERPHAIAEIAFKINKNWRTANRYVEQLEKEDVLKTHVFRKGGRGSLKIAYWPNSLTESPSSVKNFLLQRILQGRNKDDFSPLDIIQHVLPKKRKTIEISKESYHSKENVEDFLTSLKKAEHHILFFSGNLSFMNLGKRTEDFFDIFTKKLQQGVNLYMLTRVDSSNEKIVQQLLQLNSASAKGKVHIKYAQHPLRCTVIDEKEFSIKENLTSSEIDDTFIYYVFDESWVKWVTDIFWYMWNGSIEAQKRLDVIRSLIKR